MAKKLFVGNLPWETTSEELKEMFSVAGTVSSATVLSDKRTGRSRGFGFVEFADDSEAEKAVEMFNGKEVNGRQMVVNEARPMAPRTGGGYGGGGYGGGGRGGRGGGYGGGGYGGGGRGGYNRDRY